MSDYPTYYPDDAYPIGGFWKKVKKAFTPPKKIRQAIKRAVTPPKAIRKKLEAGIRRIKKSTLSDWITKGNILGITDPKVGEIMQKYVTPAMIAATSLIPGAGPLIAIAAGAAFEMAMADQAKRHGVAGPDEIPDEYYEEAQAYALEQANAAGMREAAAMGAPLFGDDVVTSQSTSQGGLPSWAIPVGILGAVWYFTRGK